MEIATNEMLGITFCAKSEKKHPTPYVCLLALRMTTSSPAKIYAPDMEQPLHVGINGLLDDGDVLPGFRVKLVDVVGGGE